VRVLRLIARLNVGGPARHVTILNRGLERAGHETLLVYGSPADGEASLAELADGLPAVPLPALSRSVSVLADLGVFVRVVRLLFAWRPDVVHTHTAKAGTVGRLAALVYNVTRGRRRRAAVVHTFHGHVLSGYFGRLASAGARAVERLLARGTDCLVTLSDRQREEIVAGFRVGRPDRTTVIPLGLELEDLLALPAVAPSLREELALQPSDVVIGYVGRLVPIKDLGTLIEAFADVAARHPEARLVLVGDGPVRPALERQVAALGLSSAVRFAGWRRDLTRLYATFDLVVLASLNEGTPVMAIEAMAAALPVVATAVGGVPDILEHGRTGLLVAPRRAGELAEALGTLVRSAETRRALGDAGRRVAAARHRSQRLVDDVLALYERLLEDRRANGSSAAPGVGGAQGTTAK